MAFRPRHLVLRSLRYHLRAHGALFASCAAASAVVAGALAVGDAVRGSLRDRALEKLSGTGQALVAARFFREGLASDLAAAGLEAACGSPVPLVLLEAAVTAGGRRAAAVQALGVDERFGRLASGAFSWKPGAREVAVNDPLARELGVGAGDEILLHFESPSTLPREHALGRRDRTLERLRLRVSTVVPARGPGLFDLANRQPPARTVFLPLDLFQRALGRPGEVNAILVPAPRDETPGGSVELAARALRRAWTLADAGLLLRAAAGGSSLQLESREFVLPGAASAAARRAARGVRAPYLEVFTNLALTIALGRHEEGAPGRPVPYSTVAALGSWVSAEGSEPPFPLPGGRWEPGTVLLNDWTAHELGARPGDAVRIEYYDVAPGGDLVIRSHSWTAGGILVLAGPVRDPGWTPEYPGVSDARTFSDWDPPFPVDLSRIQEADERYWEKHRTTPKAFVHLEEARPLWASRFGELTAVRFRPAAGSGLEETRRALEEALRAELDPASLGLAFRPVREQALRAARSATDFGALFLGLSFFLVASALLLAAMMFRLALERRGREFGLLSALGFTPGRVSRLLVAEGAGVAATGAAAGVLGGIGYAAAIIAALRSWWRGAVNAPFLALHLEGESLLAGGLSTFLLAVAVVVVVAYRLSRLEPTCLLAARGAPLDRPAPGGGRRGLQAAVLAGLAALAGVGALWAGWLAPAGAFFLEGSALLAGALALLSWWLRSGGGRALHLPAAGSRPAVARSLLVLAVAGGRRAPGRSLLAAGLLAGATFIITTVAASRRDPAGTTPRRDSGNGGFSLVARSSVPLYRALENPGSWEELGLREETRALLQLPGVEVHGLRVRPGDDTSCLNLYRPQDPRLLGVPRSFIDRGGFSWAGSLAETEAEEANPWLLLERDFGDEVVPAVGDENTVLWILHAGLGGEIALEDSRGRPLRLRIAGMLRRSLFQGELIVSETAFVERFPRRGGWSAFLVAAPPGRVAELGARLEEDLGDWGLDVREAGEVLAGFQAVENTYLDTFLVLGGLGLLLGTLGLGAALLRSVEERRGELALLGALGYSRRALAILVLGESAWLLLVGLVLGAGPALVAVLPHLLEEPGMVRWGGLGATLVAVAVAGLLSSSLALRSALRAPLLEGLRRE